MPQYYKHYESGEYLCVVCGDALFSSATKYESGSGWPAFYDVMDSAKIMTRADASGGVYVVKNLVEHPFLFLQSNGP